MTSRLFNMAFLASALMLAGCASVPPIVSNESLTVLEADEMPAPAFANGGIILSPLDKISIDVFGVEELTRNVQVDASGRISFPFVGAIDINGNSADEVEVIIANALSQGYVKNPIVSVNLTEGNGQTVAVEGSVQQPGLYPAAGRLTLLRTLAVAGGPSEFADNERIVVFRDLDDGRYAAVYNLGLVRQGIIKDPKIYANDIVVVGSSPRLKVLDRILKIAPTLTSPLILLFTRT